MSKSKVDLNYKDLFFYFSENTGHTKEVPAACLNGGIMADTGSEAGDYIFTCQDRYPLYAALAGLRCMLFTCFEHKRASYLQRIDAVHNALAIINRFTGYLLECHIPTPVFLPCQRAENRFVLIPDDSFARQIRRADMVNRHLLNGIYFNQVSPTIADLLQQFYSVLFSNGYPSAVLDRRYGEMANQAVKWHDKANYLGLVKPNLAHYHLPEHLPTAQICSSELKGLTWDLLSTGFERQTGVALTGDLYIKSGLDAAGEVSSKISKKTFEQAVADLQREIVTKVSVMGRRQTEVPLLIQPCLKFSRRSQRLPSGVGITCHIRSASDIRLVAIIGQVYEDPDHRTFIGSFSSGHFFKRVRDSIGMDRIINLASLFAEQGYRGPINFDAVLDETGCCRFIYDCNPRMGGTLPGLLLRSAIERQGITVDQMITFGYRGRIVYPDLEAKLEQLKDKKMLCTRQHPVGLMLVPSLVRPDSFDIAIVNTPLKKVVRIIESGIVHELADARQCDLKGVYF